MYLSVMTTENEHPDLRHVNGAEFKSVAVIPDNRGSEEVFDLPCLKIEVYIS
jgi:hypothetical protein